jgi:O-antigen/teichoic acid export membrane protein
MNIPMKIGLNRIIFENAMLKKLKSNIIGLKEKGAFHVVAGSFLIKFVSFFGSVFLVRLLNKSEYGILSYYENFSSYLTILMGLGLASGLQRYVVLADSYDEKKSTYMYAIKRGSLVNIFIVIFGMFYIALFPHPEVFASNRVIGYLLVLCIPFLFILNASLSTIRALFKNKLYSYVSFISSSLMVISRVIGAGLSGAELSVTFRLVIDIIVAFSCFYLIINRFFSKCNNIRLEKQFTSSLNRYSLQIMLTDGLWAVFMLNDLFLLGQFTGSETAIADYKIASVIPANLSILTSAIGIFIAPYFTKKENERDYAWVKKKFKTVLLLTSLIMGIAVLACFLFAEYLITFIYGEAYISTVSTMRLLLMASFINNGVRATIANILSSIGKQKINLIAAGIGIVLQVALNIIFIPQYGTTAVALTSCVVYFIMTMLLMVAWHVESRRSFNK